MLVKGLDLSVVRKRHSARSSAVAISDTGTHHMAGSVESDTNLLALPAEQVALLLAVQRGDYTINRVVALQEEPLEGVLLSPLTQMILIDYARRTGTDLGYTLFNTDGQRLFSCDDVTTTTGELYQPPASLLTKTINASPSPNFEPLTGELTDAKLKSMAIQGLTRSFTIRDKATSYGAAVATEAGNLYFSGQYSSFEGRTNIHAEMGAVLAALMDGDHAITDLGIVSTRHNQEPCQACGCCRQFLVEMSEKFGLEITVHNYSLDSELQTTQPLTEYLPSTWDNT